MYNRSNGIAAYGKVANFETNPVKQVVMLYDGAIKFLNLAAADIESADFAAKGEHSNRALDIINYLQSVLDMRKGGEVAVSFDDLYSKVRMMILRASSLPDAAMMRTAAGLLKPVRDAWEINSNTRTIPAPPATALANVA